MSIRLVFEGLITGLPRLISEGVGLFGVIGLIGFRVSALGLLGQLDFGRDCVFGLIGFIGFRFF